MNRRTFLMTCAASAAWACGAIPAPAAVSGLDNPARRGTRLDRLVPAIQPLLEMHNANTGERMSCTFFTADGYDNDAMARINWFMRDWRQNETKQMDVRLLWALAAIRQAAMADGAGGEIRFTSGFRTTTTNNLLRRSGYGVARNSFHIKAKAVDFSLPGVPVASVSHYARWLEVGGVGHYPGRFVHIDSGDLRTWVS